MKNKINTSRLKGVFPSSGLGDGNEPSAENGEVVALQWLSTNTNRASVLGCIRDSHRNERREPQAGSPLTHWAPVTHMACPPLYIGEWLMFIWQIMKEKRTRHAEFQ